jgi:tetratricopeptide (TPR) repeat protein
MNRPVVNLSFALNYAIHGESVWGYHATNLAIHLLAALTLFGIVRRTLTLPALWQRFAHAAAALALAIALIWTVHPLQTDAVTYTVQRTESMMGLLYLLTLYCLLRGSQARRAAWWQAAAVAACLLGMGCKEAMATAPIVAILYDRIFLSGSFRQVLRRRWAVYVAMAATAALPVTLSAVHGGRSGAAGFGYTMGTLEYAATQFGAIVHYLRLCFWPDPLVIDYGMEVAEGIWQIVPYAIVVVLLVAGTVAALRYRPRWGFLGAWFFVILAPSSSIVPLVTQTVAEKRMYLPLAAVVAAAVLAAYGAGRMLLRGPAARIAGWAVLAVLVAALGVRTYHRNRDYRTPLTIWQAAVGDLPANPRAQFNLAVALMDQGRTEEAVPHLREAIRLKPRDFEAHRNLGLAMVRLGRLEEAIGHFEDAVRIRPANYKGQYNLGLGLSKRGRFEAAIPHLRNAVRLNPDHYDSHLHLGVALLQAKEYEEAAGCFRKAARIKPLDADPPYYLSVCLSRTGRREEAAGAYRRALEIDAANVRALGNLAWLLATSPEDELRDGGKAVGLAERALAAAGPSPQLLDTLAAAQAEAGMFERAMRTQERAIELAQTQQRTDQLGKYRRHLELYRAGRPLRLPE